MSPEELVLVADRLVAMIDGASDELGESEAGVRGLAPQQRVRSSLSGICVLCNAAPEFERAKPSCDGRFLP